MIDRYILQALQTQLIAARDASAVPLMPIKMVGRTYDGSADQPFLESIFIPNNIDGEFWDSGKTYRGLYRVILHWPNDDKGAYDPMDYISSIADGFPKGLKLQVDSTYVKIYEEPNYLGDIEQTAETLYPISIRYECFKA